MPEERCQPSRDEPTALMAGRTDDEVQGLVGAIGVQEVLRGVFGAVQARFRPEQAAGQDAVVRWDVVTRDGIHSYRMAVQGGTCTVAGGVPEAPQLMLRVDLADFLRLVPGELDIMEAFMSGRLRISGDLLLARSVQRWFG